MGKHVADDGSVHNVHMPHRAKPVRTNPKRERRKTYLREWREFRGMTLEAVAEHADMTHASLSRIERGKQDYNQTLLEFLAEHYGAPDVASLLMRNPKDEDAIWSLWDNAKEGERKTIVRVVKGVLEAKG